MYRYLAWGEAIAVGESGEPQGREGREHAPPRVEDRTVVCVERSDERDGGGRAEAAYQGPMGVQAGLRPDEPRGL
jgi:hypothetical protein